MKKNERSLKSINIKDFNDLELLSFTFNRKSFFRDYLLLHTKEREEVRRRVSIVISFIGSSNLSKEIRLCHKAAILNSRQTYSFNVYLIDLVEMYFSDAIYNYKTREIKEHDHPFFNDRTLISYRWALHSRVLNSYQRYLLFEYLALGYNITDLARRRYCEPRTIYNHINSIIEELDLLVVEFDY